MIRISAGTAASVELNNNRMDAYPTTAYLLLGSQCRMRCSFCPQGAETNEARGRLGRITWPEFSWSELETGLSKAGEKGIRRICLQSVRHAEGTAPLLSAVTRLKAVSDLPLSLSAWIGDEEEAGALIAAGVERISISLDVVNPAAFKKIKGGSLQERLDLLLACARSLPGRISTHIICGLGETEAEALSMIDLLNRAKVTVALFAFVPLKGTPLEKLTPPEVGSYRRIQAGYYLLRQNAVDFASFQFEKGRLVSYGLTADRMEQILSAGAAFQTSGCPHCNRPYYNERPGGIIYNYPRPLTVEESSRAVKELIASIKG